MEFYKSDIATAPEIELIQFNDDLSEDGALAWAKSLKMPWTFVLRDNHESVGFFPTLEFVSAPDYALLDKDGKLIKKDEDYKVLAAEAKRLAAE